MRRKRIGKNAALGTLRDWMDQRQLDLHAYERRDIQKDPIEFRRYWCDTPVNGNTGIFVSSWYSDPLVSHAYGKINDDELYERLDECNAFEKVLADSNAIFCKLWFHKNKNEQEAFLRALDDDPYENGASCRTIGKTAAWLKISKRRQKNNPLYRQRLCALV